jgi:hypothetical protein
MLVTFPGAARRQPAESSRRAPRDTAIPQRPIPTRQAHAVPLSVLATSDGWLGSERSVAPSEARERLDGSDNSLRHSSLGWGLPLVDPSHPGSTLARCRLAEEFPFSKGWLGREAMGFHLNGDSQAHSQPSNTSQAPASEPPHKAGAKQRPVRSRPGRERTGSAHASLGTPQPPILKRGSDPATPADSVRVDLEQVTLRPRVTGGEGE